jgi:hypothetical protein
MTTSIRTMLVACGLAVAASASPAWALSTISGTVDGLDGRNIAVGGHRYTIGPDTDVVDRGGHRLAATELVRGTPVELDIGDDGDLAAIRATLVR